MISELVLQLKGGSFLSNSGTITAQNSLNAIAVRDNQFTQNLLKNVTDNVAGAGINSAISGKPLDESTLSSALSGALVTAGMDSGANAIGDAKLNTLASSVAHAALGCVGGAAIAGNSSGRSGDQLGH